MHGTAGGIDGIDPSCFAAARALIRTERRFGGGRGQARTPAPPTLVPEAKNQRAKADIAARIAVLARHRAARQHRRSLHAAPLAVIRLRRRPRLDPASADPIGAVVVPGAAIAAESRTPEATAERTRQARHHLVSAVAAALRRCRPDRDRPLIERWGL
jgi:hypothetical protein